ncbi:hypothetical protein OHQ88_33425 (plasmid) [Micromonospora zamorensis]|uniref:hypothetical protein n=1 Tax=Micromonospora zamorensis TaxID=709883 RepID=UPI002E1C42E6
MAAAGSTSLLLTLLAEPMASGSFAAVVGMPQLGALAASEYGLQLPRLALVPNPGPEWPTVVAALIDGVDLVVVAPPTEVHAGVARSLMARARQRGTVLVSTRPWPGCDLTVRMVNRRWLGLGQGRGRLRLQKVTLAASGRGRAERGKQVTVTLPPATLVERVGPLPGQIPGIPMDRLVDPDRVHVVLERERRQTTLVPATDLWASLPTGALRGSASEERRVN